MILIQQFWIPCIIVLFFSVIFQSSKVADSVSWQTNKVKRFIKPTTWQTGRHKWLQRWHFKTRMITPCHKRQVYCYTMTNTDVICEYETLSNIIVPYALSQNLFFNANERAQFDITRIENSELSVFFFKGLSAEIIPLIGKAFINNKIIIKTLIILCESPSKGCLSRVTSTTAKMWLLNCIIKQLTCTVTKMLCVMFKWIDKNSWYYKLKWNLLICTKNIDTKMNKVLNTMKTTWLYNLAIFIKNVLAHIYIKYYWNSFHNYAICSLNQGLQNFTSCES